MPQKNIAKLGPTAVIITILIIGLMVAVGVFIVTQTSDSVINTMGGAVTTSSSYEDFNNEADNTVPVSSPSEGAWYTFANNSWGAGGYAKVNRTIDASHPFYMNASTTPPATGWANFTFSTAYAIDSFNFYFKYLNTFASKYNHSGMEFRIKGTSDVAFIRVYGSNASVAGNKNRLLILNATSVVKRNVSVKAGLQYLVTYTPNWDAHTLNITVYNVTGASYLTKIDVTLGSETTLNKFYMQNYPASQKVCIEVENLALTKTTGSSNTDVIVNVKTATGNAMNLVVIMMIVLAAVAVLGVVMTLRYMFKEP